MTTLSRLPKGARKAVGDFLYEVGRRYYDSIPLADIFGKMAEHGIENRDGDCFLCGNDGRTTFALTMDGAELNSALILSWHRMESGRYEITSYLS